MTRFNECWCDQSSALHAAATDALNALREGDISRAEKILGEATCDHEALMQRDRDERDQRLYAEWLALPVPRPGWADFCYHRSPAPGRNWR